jgi:RNA polymerase sigma-70 factor (ECF subfamily)
MGRAQRLLQRREEAEDVVHDAFLKCIRQLSQLKEPSRFGAWLMTIAVRQCHRVFRRRRLLERLGLESSSEDVGLGRLAAPEVDPDTRLLLGQIDDCLRRVPSNSRTAWMLRHVEGCALESVAEQCGCSLATAKRRIQGAQRRLTAELCLPPPGEQRSTS